MFLVFVWCESFDDDSFFNDLESGDDDFFGGKPGSIINPGARAFLDDDDIETMAKKLIRRVGKKGAISIIMDL